MGMYLYTWFLILCGMVAYLAYQITEIAFYSLTPNLSFVLGGIVAFLTINFLLGELSKKDQEIRIASRQKSSYYE